MTAVVGMTGDALLLLFYYTKTKTKIEGGQTDKSLMHWY